jgi:TolA-binding protein
MKGKPRFEFIFIFSLISVSAIAGAASAQGIGDRNRPAESGDGRYSILGKVYLPNGKPAVDAKVSITSADAPTSTATVNLDGVFQVSGMRAGNYRVSVERAGTAPETENLTIDRFAPIGSTFNVVLHLRPARRGSEPRAGVVAANPLLADVPEDAYSKFQKGVERMAKNDPDGAIQRFNEAITAYPGFAAAYYELGSAFLKKNEPDKALEAFVKAIAAKPDFILAKYSVGYTQFIRKNYEVAAAVFDDVLKQKKDLPEAEMYLGISLYFLKQNDAAESFLKRSIANGGEKAALAHRYLGGIYMLQRRNAEAAEELQKYVDLVSQAPDAGRIRETIAELKKKP